MAEDTERQHGSGRERRGVLVRLARIVVMLGIVAMALRLSGCAEGLFFQPTREAFDTPPGYEDVEFASADGTRLHGWFIPAAGVDAEHPGPAVLHVHGNAGNVSLHDGMSAFLSDGGISVFVFDYRGFGRSEDVGPLRRGALLADTEAALVYLKSRADVDAARVGVYGVSLGGPFALHAAAGDPDVRAIATVSTFSTWPGVASDFAPVLAQILIRGGVSSTDAAARLGDRPYLILHGMEDEVVDPRHAEILAQAARSAGVATTLWTDPEGDHNRLLRRNPEARRLVTEFFREHLGAADIADGSG